MKRALKIFLSVQLVLPSVWAGTADFQYRQPLGRDSSRRSTPQAIEKAEGQGKAPMKLPGQFDLLEGMDDESKQIFHEEMGKAKGKDASPFSIAARVPEIKAQRAENAKNEVRWARASILTSIVTQGVSQRSATVTTHNSKGATVNISIERAVRAYIDRDSGQVIVKGSFNKLSEPMKEKVLSSLRSEIEAGTDKTGALNATAIEAQKTLANLVGGSAAGLSDEEFSGGNAVVELRLNVKGGVENISKNLTVNDLSIGQTDFNNYAIASNIVMSSPADYNEKSKGTALALYNKVKVGETVQGLAAAEGHIVAKHELTVTKPEIASDGKVVSPGNASFAAKSGDSFGVRGGGVDGRESIIGKFTVPSLKKGEEAGSVRFEVTYDRKAGDSGQLQSKAPSRIEMGPRVAEANSVLMASMRLDPNIQVETTPDGGKVITSKNPQIGLAVGPGITEAAKVFAEKSVGEGGMGLKPGTYAATTDIVPGAGENGIAKAVTTITPYDNAASKGTAVAVALPNGESVDLKTVGPDSIQFKLSQTGDGGFTVDNTVVSKAALMQSDNFAAISKAMGETDNSKISQASDHYVDSVFKTVLSSLGVAYESRPETLYTRLSKAPENALFTFNKPNGSNAIGLVTLPPQGFDKRLASR